MPLNDDCVEIDVVGTEFGCPNCGARRVDWLAWQNETETVECQSCLCNFMPDDGDPD